MLCGNGGIYFILHIICRKYYIGETGSFQLRWGEHVYDALTCPIQTVHVEMQEQGVGFWCMMPFAIIVKESERRAVDKKLIQVYRPQLNAMLKQRIPNDIQAVHYGARCDDRTTIQSRVGEKRTCYEPDTYTTYVLTTTRETSLLLDIVLDRVANEGNTATCEIKVIHGTTRLHQENLLTEKYTKSIATVQFADGSWSQTDTLENLATTGPGITTAIYMKFSAVIQQTELIVHKLYMERVLHDKTYLFRLSKEDFNLEICIQLYHAAALLGKEDINIARMRLRSYAKKALGYDFLAYNGIRIAYSDVIQLREIRKIIHAGYAELPYTEETTQFLLNESKLHT
jgi:hypothetical protein